LSKLLREEQVDILHTILIQSDIVGVLAASLAGTPIVISSVEGKLVADNSYLSSLHNFIRKIVYNTGYRIVSARFDCIIANSCATRDELLRDHPYLERNKIRIIYPGLEVDRFANIQTMRRSIQPAGQRIGFLGFLVQQKGAHLLLEAIPWHH